MSTSGEVTAQAAATMLGCSLKRVYQLISQGLLKATRQADMERGKLIWLVDMDSVTARLAWQRAKIHRRPPTWK